MKNHNDISAGFSWRAADRSTKRGNWLRDLAIALAIAMAVSILGMIGDAYAQLQTKTIQISGNNRTAMVTVPIGKSQDVRSVASRVAADTSMTPPAEGAASRSVVVESTGTVPPPLGVPAAAEPGLLGSDPNDDLSLGKKHYRASDYGLAEKHFRRAVVSAD